MKCPKCQIDNPDSQKFCGECATPLAASEEARPSFTKTLETPIVAFTRGTLFAGRYEIIEELGRGGMGAVYRVEDLKAKEEIALKLIKPEIAADKSTIERFRNELTTARKIAHRNVCRMFDLGEELGAHFLTMEYVPGEDLRSLIKRVRIDIETSLKIAKQVCEGLSEAHRLGVVHRDLKPANIMIDKEGSARIMDFGIARSFRSKGITGSGVMVGTPEYMSPEQTEAKEIDHRSDIYSMGVILYEMTTGHLPFEADTPIALAMKHKGEAAQNPKKLNPQIPEGLVRVILKCLEKDKEARFQSANELYSELTRIERGISTTERRSFKGKSITSKEVVARFNLKRLLFPVVMVSVVVVAALILFQRPALDVDPNRVVVAIFENQTGDEQLDPLGRMASDWISQRVSQTGDIEVVPSMAVLQAYSMLPFKEGTIQNAKTLQALAQNTGAGTLVYGTYYLTDQELHFQAHITDAQSKRLIRSLEPVKGELNDRMDVIELLSQKATATLAVYFDKRYGGSALDYRKPPAYEAYNEFLLGTESFGVDYAKSIRHFTRAAELDPSLLVAKFYMAVAYSNQGRYEEADNIIQFVNENREELTPFVSHGLDWYLATFSMNDLEEALRSIVRAEKLAPQNTTINYMHGFCALEINHPLETVETYARLDSFDPEVIYSRVPGAWRIGYLAEAHHMLRGYKQELKEARKGQKYYPDRLWLRAYEARALAALGKIDDVRKVISECLDVVSSAGTPGDVMLEAARTLRAHGHREPSLDIANQAVEWYRDTLQLQEATEEKRFDLATALYTAERWDEAQAMFEDLVKNNPDNIEYLGRIGLLAARKGDRDKALRISEALASIDRPYVFGKHTYMCARISSLLGEKEQTMELLRNAFAQGLVYGAYLHNEMDLESLRNYRPFQELLEPKG